MAKSARHTLLVVDDEPNVVQSLKDLLRLDYTVIGAARGAEGLLCLDQREVDVVLTDQRMPGMTGVEFLHKVRERHPDTTRLLLTGYADLRAVIEAINLGNVYRYIAKPWDPEELRGVLREACERRDLLRERQQLLLELQRKNEDLERANELKTTFIRVAGHELRTPVTLQLGLLGLARRAEMSDRARDLVERVQAATQRLARRVEQMMSLLYAESFTRPLDRSPVEVEALMRLAVEDVRPFAELRGQTLTVTLAPDLGVVEIDAPKIEDSLNQLLLNAIKFTPDGGEVRLTAARVEGGLRIEVSDTGVGIAPDLLPHLFEPFFTGLDSDRHSSGRFEFGARGLGLGLSVVRAFATLHGGTVRVRSEPGLGSTFTLEIPVP